MVHILEDRDAYAREKPARLFSRSFLFMHIFRSCGIASGRAILRKEKRFHVFCRVVRLSQADRIGKSVRSRRSRATVTGELPIISLLPLSRDRDGKA